MDEQRCKYSVTYTTPKSLFQQTDHFNDKNGALARFLDCVNQDFPCRVVEVTWAYQLPPGEVWERSKHVRPIAQYRPEGWPLEDERIYALICDQCGQPEVEFFNMSDGRWCKDCLNEKVYAEEMDHLEKVERP